MTYMKVLELLIPSVIRELFVSRDDDCIKLALLLASPFQLKVLLGWYVFPSEATQKYRIPYIMCSKSIPSGMASMYVLTDVWTVISKESTTSSEIKEFLKSRKA